MYVGQGSNYNNPNYYPLNRAQGLNPVGGNPSTKMLEINGLKDEKSALGILANAGSADTLFLFDSDQVEATVKKVFNDYLLNAEDHNLKKNGAYFLVSWNSKYDAQVYYHHLIKALQDNGKDVYFVVLKNLFSTALNVSRIVSSSIHLENHQNNNAWHPYYLSVEINHLTYEVSGLRTMNSPTGPFTKFPRITGWSRETETFSWDGNQAMQNSPKPAAPAPSPNPQTSYPTPSDFKPFANPLPAAQNPASRHVQPTSNPAPQTTLPLRKMIEMGENRRTPAGGIEIAKNAEKAHTYFFYRPDVFSPEVNIVAFENYLNESKDKNLCKKGAYIMDEKSDRHNNFVYYHYLIKALQDKGLDVYFVTVFRRTPNSDLPLGLQLAKSIEIEGNRNDFYRPYSVRMIENPKSTMLNMYELPEIITSMPADYKPNDQFAAIPKIIGWSSETVTFKCDGTD